MSVLHFPCTLFKSQKWMDDYGAEDMRCGDLSQAQLKTQFHLVDVSAKVNPYTLAKITPFNQPQSMFYGARKEGKALPERRVPGFCLMNAGIYPVPFLFMALISTWLKR